MSVYSPQERNVCVSTQVVSFRSLLQYLGTYHYQLSMLNIPKRNFIGTQVGNTFEQKLNLIVKPSVVNIRSKKIKSLNWKMFDYISS